MKTIRIGVSGMNAADNPGPGLGVARALKEDASLPVRVIGLVYDAMEPGIYRSEWVDRAFLMPYPSAGGEALLERLAYIRDHEGLDLVIPNLDTELPLYLRYRAEIEALGIRIFLPEEAGFQLRSKERLAELAPQIGLDMPKTLSTTTVESFLSAVGEIGYPVMVKGAFYKAYRADTQAQALANFHAIAADWGTPVLVQKIVGGEELNVVGVGDGDGGHLGLVAIKKLMVTAIGKIWTGVSVHHAGMLEASARFVRETKWRGPFELECMVEGDAVHLIEINPRFPAWSYFASAVGVPLQSNLVRRALGLPVAPPPEGPAGKLFIRTTLECVGDHDAFQQLILKGESKGALGLNP